MKKLLILIFTCFVAIGANAQIFQDTIPHYFYTYGFQADTLTAGITPDTSATPLWQIGHTTKAFYPSDTLPVKAIMTDTLHPYPINANNSFSISFVHNRPNIIVDVWHKYQTTSHRDGGIIEFSADSGATWLNIVDCWMIFNENLYSSADTLFNGEPGFNGNSGGQLLSRFQFFDCAGEKSTSATSCSSLNMYSFYFHPTMVEVRFRFASDSTSDSLAGWEIDSIKLESPGCAPGAVKEVSKNGHLNIFPNPSFTGDFNFPELPNQSQYTLDIYSAIGQKIFSGHYSANLSLKGYSTGTYFYRVSNGIDHYSGQLLLE